jgi:ATP-binding cassette subfamily B protein
MLEKVNYKDVARFALHYWKKRPWMGLLLVVLMLIATLVETVFPVYTGRIVDVLATHKPGDPGVLRTVAELLAVYISFSFSYHFFRWTGGMLWARFAVRNLHAILTDAMAKVQKFSADWHANAFAGGTVRKITRGMWAFDVFGDTIFFGIMPTIVVLIGMTVMLTYNIPLVGLFAATMALIYCAFSIWISLSLLAPRFKASAKADTRVGAALADAITGNATVKAFGAEAREEQLFGKITRLWRLRSQKAWLTAEATHFSRGLIRSIMASGMLGLTAWLWSRGQATPGDIALALNSYHIIGGYMRDIGQHITNMQRSISDMEDVVSFWLREDDVRDKPDAKSLDVTNGEIVFSHVRFVYKSQTKALFEDLNVTIRPGEKVALVGVSGSGKSTFVKLVQRLYDVTGGDVRIDGQNVSEVTQESLRQHIALVPQEPVLFHRSLAANIAYGNPDATMEDIISAAKQAYAHEFIETLPLGYGTLVGERGVKLSGGERQRVAIARAILADTPILILDEATSSLDSISEFYIQKALKHLMEGRTTITIAHRLSTIRNADRILVFEHGRIVEQGRHDELLRRDDSGYKKLYEMQAFELTGTNA